MGDFVVNFFESLGYVYFVSQCINRNEKYKLLHSYFLFIASLVILTVSSYLTHIDQITLFLITSLFGSLILIFTLSPVPAWFLLTFIDALSFTGASISGPDPSTSKSRADNSAFSS